MEGHIFGIFRYLSTQIIAFAKEAKSKKLLFQELPYHGVNIIFYNQGQVLKSLGSYMYMRVFTVFEQFLCLLTGFQMPYRTLCSPLFPNIDTCINKGDWRFQL